MNQNITTTSMADTTTSGLDTDDGLEMYIVIGIVVGLIIVIVVLTLLSALCVRRRYNRKPDEHQERLNHNHNSHNNHNDDNDYYSDVINRDVIRDVDEEALISSSSIVLSINSVFAGIST